MTILIVLITIATIIIVLGLALVFLSIVKETAKRGETEKRVEGGAVLIIGPLPIVFGTSEKITRVLLVLALLLFAITLITFIILKVMQ